MIFRSLGFEDNIKDLDSRCKAISGKSGAFFYFTADKEYIIKTITSEELEVLKSMIDDYVKRTASETPSYLAKILGVFKIKSDKSNSMKVVLMENLTCKTDSPIIFDLKGSKQDRRETESLYASLEFLPRSRVLKDIDFYNNINHIYVENLELLEILKVFELDTNLLEKYSIMDYSLLILIEETSSLKGTQLKTHNYIKFGKFIVFIGIIDYLQPYNTRKKLESAYKNFNKKEITNISAIPPTPYRRRFLKMIRTVFSSNKLN